jgi:hypothetical protein
MRFEERGNLKKVGWSEGNRVCEGELDVKGVFFGLGFQVFLEKGASICVVMEFIALNFGWGSVGWVGDGCFCGPRTPRFKGAQPLLSLKMWSFASLAQCSEDTMAASRNALVGQARQRLSPFALRNPSYEEGRWLCGGGKTYFGDVMGLDEEWGCGHKGRHVEKRI